MYRITNLELKQDEGSNEHEQHEFGPLLHKIVVETGQLIVTYFDDENTQTLVTSLVCNDKYQLFWDTNRLTLVRAYSFGFRYSYWLQRERDYLIQRETLKSAQNIEFTCANGNIVSFDNLAEGKPYWYVDLKQFHPEKEATCFA